MLMDNLEKDGDLVLGYVFFNRCNIDNNPIFEYGVREKVFPMAKFDYRELEYNNGHEKDLVISKQKIKK